MSFSLASLTVPSGAAALSSFVPPATQTAGVIPDPIGPVAQARLDVALGIQLAPEEEVPPPPPRAFPIAVRSALDGLFAGDAEAGGVNIESAAADLAARAGANLQFMPDEDEMPPPPPRASIVDISPAMHALAALNRNRFPG